MPTFSEVTIEFITDFEEDYTLSLVRLDSGTTTDTFTWVTTRSAGFEVTTGTPTGNPGETTAINFEAAFDLDNLTGFVTAVQNTNEVLIQSETQGEDFIGISATDENGTLLTIGVDYNVTFNNYVEPPDTSNIDLALVRSPHYINIPFNFSTTTSITINLYVWSGDLTVIPSTPTYTITKPRPTTDFTAFDVDISRLIEEQIETSLQTDFTLTSQVVDSTTDSVKWVYYTVSYTDPVQTIADIEGTLSALDGYGLYSEGINPTKPANNVLTSSTMRKVSRDGVIVFPFINNGVITSIDIDSDGGEINETETITTSAESTEFIQYIDVDVIQAATDDFITFTTLPANNTFTYEIVDECRYDPIQLMFKNRYGVFDSITLFKKSNNSISTENDEFVNNSVSNGTYDTTKHQYQKLNVQAKKELRAQSGYISQSENDLYEELLNSEQIFIFTKAALVPINIKTSSLEFKTRVNDRLVNYELTFEYAYNIIQNV